MNIDQPRHHSSPESWPKANSFTWLFARDAPPPEAPNILLIEESCRILVNNWQILPAAYPRLRNWAGDTTSKHLDNIECYNLSIRAFTRVQQRVIFRLLSALNASEIRYALLKGAATAYQCYSEREERSSIDVDIAIEPREIYKAEKIAQEHGFVPAEWHPEIKRFSRAPILQRRLVEAKHYELGFLVRRQVVTDLTADEEAAIVALIEQDYRWHRLDDGRFACYVTVDLHHAISLDIPVKDVLRTANEHIHAGQRFFVSSLGWLLIQLIFKLYWEGVHNYQKGLYQYADLSRLLFYLKIEEFDQIRSQLETLKLQAAAFYVLRRLPVEFSTELPAFLEPQMRDWSRAPKKGKPYEWNDAGDMWDKIWGVRY